MSFIPFWDATTANTVPTAEYDQGYGIMGYLWLLDHASIWVKMVLKLGEFAKKIKKMLNYLRIRYKGKAIILPI